MPLSTLNTNSITSVSNTAISGTIIGTQLGSGITGQVSFFAFSSVPTGWIKANGAAISRTTYASLFAAIGTVHGSGDGTTTFNVPDLRGEFLRCLDDGRSIDSSRSIGTAQGQQNETHNHTITAGPHTGGYQYSQAPIAISRGYPAGIGGGPYSHIINADNDAVFSTGNFVVGGSGGTESRPRNVALLACIKF
jgi:phage-related tail fiber protein